MDKREPTFINPQYINEDEIWSRNIFSQGEANTPDEHEPFLGSSKATQVGGDHYTKLKIQPMEYSMANELNALQHTAIKYVTRYQDKGTPLQDLAKAKHCIDMMIEDWMENHE